MSTATELIPAEPAPPPAPSAMLVDVATLRRGLEERGAMVTAIKSFMGSLLRPDTHYGVIPGTQKPTLLQPGAEDLALAARAHYEIVKEEVRHLTGDHQDVRMFVRVVNANGETLGEGVGTCSTMESRYRYRGGARKCPKCGAEAIIKGKPEYAKRDGPDFKEGGWLCFGKKGGCNAKFKDKAPEILDQSIGQVENPDPADQWNTVAKMAFKRAQVCAAKAAFGVSSLFTQDLEDQRGHEEAPPPAAGEDVLDHVEETKKTRGASKRPTTQATPENGEKAAAAPSGDPERDALLAWLWQVASKRHGVQRDAFGQWVTAQCAGANLIREQLSTSEGRAALRKYVEERFAEPAATVAAGATNEKPADPDSLPF